MLRGISSKQFMAAYQAYHFQKIGFKHVFIN